MKKKNEKKPTEPETSDYPDHVVATIAVRSGALDLIVAPDNKYVYVSNNMDGTVSVIRTSDNSVVATVSVAERPNAVQVHPSGSYVYVTHDNFNSRMYIIRTSDNSVIDSSSCSTNICGFAVSTDGNFIYMPSSTRLLQEFS